MKERSTTNCRRFGHPEILIHSSDTILDIDVEHFVETLEKMVASGSTFKASETFQVGWLLTKFHEGQNGVLTLYEPDMQTFPMRFVHSVSNTLQLLRLHKDVVESYFSPDVYDCPSALQPCIICTDLVNSEEFMMERFEPEGNASGWFIGCTSGDHDHNDTSHLRFMSTYEAIICINRRPLPYLALPVGTFLLFIDDELMVRWNNQELEVRSGSFLDGWINRAG